MRTIVLINSSLIVLTILLLAYLLLPVNSITGAMTALAAEEPHCYLQTNNATKPLAMQSCCYYAQQQLTCDTQENGNISCYTGQHTQTYVVNAAGADYCQKNGYYVAQ